MQPNQQQQRHFSTGPSETRRSVFQRSPQEVAELAEARTLYHEFAGKSDNRSRLMRDIMDPQNGIDLNPHNKLEKVIIDLRDSSLMQRLKFVNQLSTGSWAYHDATHSRFGHVLGVADLTAKILNYMGRHASEPVKKQLEEYGPAVVAFGLTHDLGHIAPGSHIAQRVWFPQEKDMHEEISHRLLREDPGFRLELEMAISPEGARKLDLIVAESPLVPKWTWQLITSGGWNTDRGDWVSRDGHFCGVNYGMYDLPIITKNLTITDNGELGIREPGVTALESFFTARASMYRNVYGHKVAKIGEMMHVALGRRARELFAANKPIYADETMQAVLSAKSSSELPLATMLDMVEYWWSSHVSQWAKSDDLTLSELSKRILVRQPFKHYEPEATSDAILRRLVETSGLDPDYFFVQMRGSEVKLREDLNKAFKVVLGDGTEKPLTDYSKLMSALSEIEKFQSEPYVAAPMDVYKFFKPQ